MYSNTTLIFSIAYTGTILQKNTFFIFKEFCTDSGLFGCLIYGLLSIFLFIFARKCFFSSVCSILQLMFWNLNLNEEKYTMLLSSNMEAPTLFKWMSTYKKHITCFFINFCNSWLEVNVFTLCLWNQKKIFPYLELTQYLVMKYIIFLIHTYHKSTQKLDFFWKFYFPM